MKSLTKKSISVFISMAVFLMLFFPAFADSKYEVIPNEEMNKTVSGRISLPDGIVASGDITVGIDLYPDYRTFTKDFYNYKEVVIKQNTQFVDYEIAAPENASFILSFNSISEISNEVFRYGYYSSSGSSMSYENATSLTISEENLENINFTFIKGKVISGNVILPEGAQISDNSYFCISVQSDNNTPDFYEDDFYNSSYIEKLPENSTSFPYSVCVMENKNYILSFDGHGINGALNRGFYTANGAVIDMKSASPISVGSSSLENIDVKLSKGVNIQGKITLPDNLVAPEEGISVMLSAVTDNGTEEIWDDDYNANTDCYIKAGENSGTYSMTVPQSSGTNYMLNYYLSQNKLGLFTEGYYTPDGVTRNYIEAKPLIISNNDLNNVDLTLLKGAVIKGNISLPDGLIAPEYGLSVELSCETDNMTPDIYEDDYYAWGSAFIEGGKNSGEFYVTVDPAKTGYTIGYHFYNSEMECITNGYYNVNGTVRLFMDATKISDLSQEINLNILKGIKVTGTISLPEGMQAPEGGLYVFAECIPQDSSKEYAASYTDIYIEEGNVSSTYTLILDPQMSSGYKVRYNLCYKGTLDNLVNTCYYNKSGSVYTIDKATTVYPDSIATLNANLLTGVEIGGTLNIPKSLANSEYMYTYVSAYSDNGTPDNYNDDLYADKQISIDGKTSIPFTLSVAPEANYIISYGADGNLGEYLTTGYYGKKGMVYNRSAATPIMAGSLESKNIKLSFLKGIKVSGIINIETTPDNSFPSYINISGFSDNNTPDNYNDDLGSYTNVNVTEGQNNVSYELYVAPNQQYVISYYQYESPVHNEMGYYTKNGTVNIVESAEKVSVKNKEVKNIDLSVNLIK